VQHALHTLRLVTWDAHGWPASVSPGSGLTHVHFPALVTAADLKPAGVQHAKHFSAPVLDTSVTTDAHTSASTLLGGVAGAGHFDAPCVPPDDVPLHAIASVTPSALISSARSALEYIIEATLGEEFDVVREGKISEPGIITLRSSNIS